MGGRKQNFTEPKSGIHIIGEGLTEQWYFTHLKKIFNYRCTIKPSLFGKTSILDIDKKIEDVLKGDLCIICVFDADVSGRNKIEKEKLKELRIKYANNKKVMLCDSLPSIEYWFLLHYIDTCPHYNNSRDVERDLKRHITDYDKSESFLENQKWVSDMSLENGSLDNAKERAERYCNSELSYSKLYLAFQKLK